MSLLNHDHHHRCVILHEMLSAHWLNKRKRCLNMNTALKLVFFLARKLVGIAIIILLIVLATFIAYDMANIYVVVNDGLSQN